MGESSNGEKSKITSEHQYDDAEEVVPTRLIIFESGIKVDFAFYTLNMLPKLIWCGDYKVLLEHEARSFAMRHARSVQKGRIGVLPITSTVFARSRMFQGRPRLASQR